MNLKIDEEEIKTLIDSYDEKDTDCIIFEELAELIKAFSKFKRYGGLQEAVDLMKEMADVYIVLGILKEKLHIYDNVIQAFINMKMRRNLERIED